MAQMLTCLERLISYQVDLKNVKLCRINFTPRYMENGNLPAKTLEPYPALAVLNNRGFTGPNSSAMAIKADGTPG